MQDSISEKFEENPARFLETAIREFVASSKSNCLPAFDNEPIFEEPLVGFADGDDPIFQEYKKQEIVGEFHYTPREILEKHVEQKEGNSSNNLEHISVISCILPISLATRLSLRRETQIASLRWNHTRWLGQDLINELSRYLVSDIENKGYYAIAPDLSPFFSSKELNGVPVSNWSQRHIAYAAGLGTFSLSDGFITPRGIAMRCGSIVCNLMLPPTPRPYAHYMANCLFFNGKKCRRCIERCPGEAISESGHDKKRCRDYLQVKQKEILSQLGKREGYMGRYLGCGLCQTKVPCESGIPPVNPCS